MKSILLKVVLITVVLCVGVYFFAQEKIINSLMLRIVEKNFSSDLLDTLPDGLHVVLCGAGSPLPDPKRAGPCTAVIAGKQLYIVDAGSGSSKNLTLFKIPQGKINSILLTHFHSDHIDGLGEMLMQRWVNAANENPVPIYGPPGVEEIVNGFNMAYLQDQSYRVAHHGADLIIPSGAGGLAMPFTIPEPGQLLTVLEKDDLKISVFVNEHEPVSASVGYRFDYKNRSVVISGDTKKSKNLEQLSQGVDLLVHEALNKDMVDVVTEAATRANQPRLVKITTDILDYHTSPVEAAEIARDAKITHLLYTHIVPPLPLAPMEKIFVKGVDEVYSGGVTVGQDGTKISLPASTKEIIVGKTNTFIRP